MLAVDQNQCEVIEKLLVDTIEQGCRPELPVQTTLKKAAGFPSVAAFAFALTTGTTAPQEQTEQRRSQQLTKPKYLSIFPTSFTTAHASHSLRRNPSGDVS
jgi:hypothetical protein